MPRCAFFVVSESASLDVATNRLSIFHILEQISAPSFPAVHPISTMVAMVERTLDEPDEISVHARVAVNGNPLGPDVPITLAFQGHLRLRFIGNLQGIVVPEHGVLEIDLRYDDNVIGSWKVQVDLVAQPALSTQEASPAL